ncbi:MAG: DUF4432 family protein [Devosia sp.]
MTADDTVIELHAERFGDRETVLARFAGLTATTFRYCSGVAGLRIANADGSIVALPFQGQQIWDATFFGRQLTMRSLFDEPLDTDDFYRTYGGFFLHCGALAMGDAAAADTHPVHGELPNARYQQAWLSTGRDAAGPFMRLHGSYHHRVAFHHHYAAEPTITMRSKGGRIDTEMHVRNLRHVPMDLMYLAHINFRPIDGARLVDTVAEDGAGIHLRTGLPGALVASDAYRRLIALLTTNPGAHRTMLPEIDPELVLALDTTADAAGWANGMQLLPDGSADFVSYRPSELDHCLRWITRTPEMDALGLMLPATAEADGYIAEKAKGNVRSLAPGAGFRCSVSFGALDPAAAAAVLEHIESARRP